MIKKLICNLKGHKKDGPNGFEIIVESTRYNIKLYQDIQRCSRCNEILYEGEIKKTSIWDYDLLEPKKPDYYSQC